MVVVDHAEAAVRRVEVATGRVTDACTDRHRHQEFLGFLKQAAAAYPRRELHVVVDKLRHPQAPGRPRPAQTASADHPALHPDLGLLVTE